jgi:hypothetical protein
LSCVWFLNEIGNRLAAVGPLVRFASRKVSRPLPVSVVHL